jgi:hypothetical protein
MKLTRSKTKHDTCQCCRAPPYYSSNESNISCRLWIAIRIYCSERGRACYWRGVLFTSPNLVSVTSTRGQWCSFSIVNVPSCLPSYQNLVNPMIFLNLLFGCARIGPSILTHWVFGSGSSVVHPGGPLKIIPLCCPRLTSPPLYFK